MMRFLSSHKIVVIIALLLAVTGVVVAVVGGSGKDGKQNANDSNSIADSTQAPVTDPPKNIVTETSDNVMMSFMGNTENIEKHFQKWAYDAKIIEFEKSYSSELVVVDNPYEVYANSQYALDISEAGDGGVVAYKTADNGTVTLHIAGKDGVVMANPNSKWIFAFTTTNTNVQQIHFNGCFNTSKAVDMSRMFGNCFNLQELDLSGFDTSNVTNMFGMFDNCKAMKSVDLTNFNTSNVTDMSHMFDGCRSLTTLDVSMFDTSKVVDMLGMFYLCESLTELDLSGFDTSNVVKISYMFKYCDSLEYLDLTKFNTLKVEDVSEMFACCRGLKTLNISGFSMPAVKHASSVFAECDIARIIYNGKDYTNLQSEELMLEIKGEQDEASDS